MVQCVLFLPTPKDIFVRFSCLVIFNAKDIPLCSDVLHYFVQKNEDLHNFQAGMSLDICNDIYQDRFTLIDTNFAIEKEQL